MEDESFASVPYIDYEKALRKPRDWTIVLGQGLQGTVELMEYYY
jgi:hypothetical protein